MEKGVAERNIFAVGGRPYSKMIPADRAFSEKLQKRGTAVKRIVAKRHKRVGA
jgi:hypothetical protein